MSIYFSSDFHFGHVNICRGTSRWSDKSGTRPFSSLEEMNETILENLNSVVMPDDQLFFLGDFCFGDTTLTPKWRERIKCRDISFIRGNHDQNIDLYRNSFRWIKDYFEFRHLGKTIVMMHYPIASWNKSHHGSLHLFGHCHGSFRPLGRSMDVGIDTNNFKPYSFDEIVDKLEKIPLENIGHH